MKTYIITITRPDGSVGRYTTTHEDTQMALRYAARSLDIINATSFHLVEKD